MALVCLPCEIYQREFDAKLLLGVRLAAQHGHAVLIGYDKYFNATLPRLGPVGLVEKSMSSILHQGRIAPVKDAGGVVMICDEEGINNVGVMGEESWLIRIDPTAVPLIDLYACWGERDAKLFSRVKGLRKKMLLLGNSRSDLLGPIGRAYFQETTLAIQEVFGRFVLVSDNFAIERFGPKLIPRFAVAESRRQRMDAEIEQWEREARIRRKHFTSILEKVARKRPGLTLVIRPHPRSHPGWWHRHFGAFRNVHVLSRHAVEPWLHAADAVVSMGCTTGLQALYAHRPVVEVATPGLPTHGLASRLLGGHVSTAAATIEALDRLTQPGAHQHVDWQEARRSWAQTQRSSTKFLARALDQLCRKLPAGPATAAHAPCRPQAPGVNPDPGKWSECPRLEEVRLRAGRAARALGCPQVRVSAVSAGVWELGPDHSCLQEGPGRKA